MKVYGKGTVLNNLEVKPHNIVVAYTSPQDYEMSRQILLKLSELDYGEYVLLEGGHCSCYDFDETEWDAIVYTEEELLKLANAKYNEGSLFWKIVREYLNY